MRLLRRWKHRPCVLFPDAESDSFALRFMQCVFYRVIIWHPVALNHGIAHAVSDAEPNCFADANSFPNCNSIWDSVPHKLPE